MKGQIIPAFEKEFKCKVETDSAFPYYPKLQATPKNAPLYDVLHTNTSEQWQAVVEGLVEPKLYVKDIPNLADVFPYAVSDKIFGVSRLHQRDRLRLSHRQGPAGAEILEGSRRPEILRRARQLHHPDQQPRPDASDDARQDLRQGADRSRRRLQGAGAAEADQDVRLHRRHGKGAALGRSEYRRAARQRHLSLRRAEPADRIRGALRRRALARAGVDRHARLQGAASSPTLRQFHAAAGRPEAARRGRVVFARRTRR